jgi:hypothetical protein
MRSFIGSTRKPPPPKEKGKKGYFFDLLLEGEKIPTEPGSMQAWLVLKIKASKFTQPEVRVGVSKILAARGFGRITEGRMDGLMRNLAFMRLNEFMAFLIFFKIKISFNDESYSNQKK